MARIAIIGSGISGLGCAHFLHREHEITVFETDPRVGGHAHTVEASETGGRRLPIDTGFMVFNRVTYPNLCRLFAELDVPTKPTDMSFAVRDDTTGLEWCGSSLNHLFAQRKNLFSARFWRMLSKINRFNKEAVKALEDPLVNQLTLADYVRQRGYGEDFFNLYLVPMSSAVWSTPPALMLEFPAGTLLRFFHNHGFLGLHTQHPWLTVDGGSREYVRRLTAPFRDQIQTGNGATRIVRNAGFEGNITVLTANGRTQVFDKVILACQADQALKLIVNPTPPELRLLGAFKYQPNLATLHTDTSVMPRTRRAWSSWNYQISRDTEQRVKPATHYWMNQLQGVSEREQFFVSINGADRIDSSKIQHQIPYRHPLFDLAAIKAQGGLPSLNKSATGTTETYFAGSYFRYGFHEDGLHSAVQLCTHLLGRDPWEKPASSPA